MDEEGFKFWLSNDENENDAFFDLEFNGKTVSISLNEMLSALIALDASRSRRLIEQEQLHSAGL